MTSKLESAELRHHLVVLQGRVDQHFVQALKRSPQAFACAPGCSSCCQAGLSVFEIEAAAIRLALDSLAQHDPERRAIVREQANDPTREHCSLLVHDRCAIYADRPLICRAHGLATKVVLDDGSSRIDHCPLNYKEQQPPPASVLVLDAVNQPLALLSELWSRTVEQATSAKRITLDEVARGTSAAT